MFAPTDVSFVYSGGQNNRDPQQSLGGTPSVQLIVGNVLNNLFDDVSTKNLESGRVDWRCFYIFNDNPIEILYNTTLFISSEISNGANILLGFHQQNDQQALSLSDVPVIGAVILSYENHTFTVDWGGSLTAFADNIVAGLVPFTGENMVQVLDVINKGFLLEFLGGKFQPLLGVVDSTLGVSLSIAKIQNGAPVNTITVEVDSVTTPPNGISYFYPTITQPFYLGDLFPGDGVPVWIQRTVVANSTSAVLDGFSLRLIGDPLSRLEPPPAALPLVGQVTLGGSAEVGLLINSRLPINQ